jgi:hypothetical protein
MDEQTRLFLWVLAGGAFFGLLGAAFGAVSGALTWKSGRAAGTALGLAVARAFARAADSELSRGRTGALVGAVDGLAFLGCVGVGIGFVAGCRGPAEWQTFGPAMLAGALLVAGGLFFGALAYGVVAGGVRAVAALFAGALIAAVLGYDLAGLHGLLIGCVAGAVAGTLAARCWR